MVEHLRTLPGGVFKIWEMRIFNLVAAASSEADSTFLLLHDMVAAGDWQQIRFAACLGQSCSVCRLLLTSIGISCQIF